MSILLSLLIAAWPAPGPLQSPTAPPRAVARPSVQIELRSGRPLAGELLSATTSALTVKEGDREESVSLDDVLLLALGLPPSDVVGPPPPPAAGAPDLVFLTSPKRGTGDRLVGRLKGGDEYGIRFQSDGAEPVTIAFDQIERLLPRADRPVDRLATLEGAGADDRVWRRKPDGTLDHVAGVVERLDGEQLVFNGAIGTHSFALAELVAVVLAASPADEAPLPGRQVVVRLRGGSRLSAGLLELSDERVVLATRFAERLELPLASLASLVVRDEQVVLLADLVPVAVREWPSVGQPDDFLFPWRADLSVTGRLLTVDGVPRATGLGVHANSTLGFDLPAGARRLRVTGGLVDEVLELPAAGSVRFEIRVGDEVRARSEVLREGQPAAVLRVDSLPAGGRLELRVDDGGDDDAGDRAAWVDGVILLGDA